MAALNEWFLLHLVRSAESTEVVEDSSLTTPRILPRRKSTFESADVNNQSDVEKGRVLKRERSGKPDSPIEKRRRTSLGEASTTRQKNTPSSPKSGSDTLEMKSLQKIEGSHKRMRQGSIKNM